MGGRLAGLRLRIICRLQQMCQGRYSHKRIDHRVQERKRATVKQEPERHGADPVRGWNSQPWRGGEPQYWEPDRELSPLAEGTTFSPQRTAGASEGAYIDSGWHCSCYSPKLNRARALPPLSPENHLGCVAWILNPQITRAPWACPHLYIIKCFVY